MENFKHRVAAMLSALALVVGLGSIGTAAQAAPTKAVPSVSTVSLPPPTNPAWEAKADAKKVEPWQFAPKGRIDSKNAKTLRVGPVDKRFKPRDGVEAPIPPSGLPVYRNYNNIKQTVSSPVDGALADMTIADPYLNYGGDWHSLMEIAVQDDSGNIVEVGWTVNPTLCPSEPAGSQPCLFVYSWRLGVGQGYGVDFVDAPMGTYSPGSLLPNPNDSSGLNFRIAETTDAWWIGAGATSDPNYWVGYFPKTNWTDNGASFDQMTLFQMFTEVATTETISPTWNTATPCSDAGNGYAPTSPNGGTQAARIVNIKTSVGTVATNATPTWGNDPSTLPTAAGAVYPMQTPATNNFRVGGPGFRSNNTLPGVRDFCGT